LRAALANVAWLVHASAGARAWRRAARRVEAAQEAVLARIVSVNRETAFGREHGFAAIDSVAEFRRRVPVRTYSELQPYLERIANGEAAVLTADPVRHFGVSSGTTDACKLVPYTASLLQEFQAGIAPWVFHLFRSSPRLLLGTTYWSITPVGGERRSTPAGIPIGFDDDRSYLDRATRWVLATLMPIPPELARLDDMDVFRYVTLRLLLQQESLRWVSVWNPTFLTLLVGPLVEWHQRLLDDLERGTISTGSELPPRLLQAAQRRPARARRLRAVFAAWAGRPATEPDESGRTLYEEVWPKLSLISCWAHGSAAEAVPLLRAHFPSARVQPKGLLATEAFVSFPLRDDLSALALGSHFFELADSSGDLRLAHELELGKRYSVVVTTGGGLYRYRLGDLVEVDGFEHDCPLIRFLGKENNVVDLRGEKLEEGFARGCVDAAFGNGGVRSTFSMLAPHHCEAGLSYVLFVQFPGETQERLGEELEALLRASFHYDYCRRLGQLGPCRVFAIDPAADAQSVFLATRTRLGQRLGDIKPAALDRYDGWAAVFPGRFL
jgi:hypothetical protein